MNPTLLLVDDNDENLDLLSRCLRKAGYGVLLAKNGNEALKMIKNQPPALVVLDIMMPGLGGFEVLTRIRNKHSPLHLPVIMASARWDEEDVAGALRIGANDYITKPYHYPTLISCIKTQLSPRRAERIPKAATRIGVPQTSRFTPKGEQPTAIPSKLLDISTLETLRELKGEGKGDLLTALIDSFVNTFPSLLTELKSAMVRGDPKAVMFQAHAMRGRAANVGAKTVQALCGKLEELGEESKLEGAKFVVAQLEKEFQSVTQALKGWRVAA